jgi:hypothetical protein
MAKKYKWHLSTLQLPISSHLVVTAANADNWKELSYNLEDCINHLLANPELNKKGDAAYYGLADAIPNKSIVGDFLVYYLEAVLDVL